MLPTDVHTHNPAATWPSILHVEATPDLTLAAAMPQTAVPGAEAPGSPDGNQNPPRGISLGIHPWNADLATLAPTLETIRRHAAGWQPKPAARADVRADVRAAVRAIGECGLDRLRGPAIDIQRQVFEAQAKLAAELHLPLIIHCVRAWDILLDASRRLKGPEPWIVHGFRGKPQLAKQLLDAGLDLSFGQHFNPQSLALTPAHRRHVETDDSPLPLHAILRLQSPSDPKP